MIGLWKEVRSSNPWKDNAVKAKGTYFWKAKMPSEIHNTNDQTCDICKGVCEGGFLGWTKLRESCPPGMQMMKT